MAAEIDRILRARTPLEVLSLSETADEATYRAAFRRLSLLVHPDKVTDNALKQQATAAFRELFNSYMTLKMSIPVCHNESTDQWAFSSVSTAPAPRAPPSSRFTKWWQHATVEEIEKAFMREEEQFLLEIEPEKQRYIAQKQKKRSSAFLTPRVVIPIGEAIALAERDEARAERETAKWQSFRVAKTSKNVPAASSPKRLRVDSPRAPTLIAPPASEPVVTKSFQVPQVTLVSRLADFSKPSTVDATSALPKTIDPPKKGIKFSLAAPRNGARPKLVHRPQSKRVHKPSQTISGLHKTPHPAEVRQKVGVMLGNQTSANDTAVALLEIGQPSVQGWTSSRDADR